MLLLSPRMVLITGWVLKLGYLIKVTPFVRNGNSVRLSLTSSKSGLLVWYFLSIFFQIHQWFLFIRLWQSIKNDNQGVTYYILRGVYAVTFVIPTVCQFTQMTRRHQVMEFHNIFITYCIQFDGMLIKLVSKRSLL